MTWQHTTAKKRNELQSAIPDFWKPQNLAHPNVATNVTELIDAQLSDAERQVTATDGKTLLESLHNGTFTASEVVNAHCHRAALANHYTNCLSEVLFASAADVAKELDTYMRERGQPIGPLHGLPISLMDRFHVAGVESACGFADWIGDKKQACDEGIMVQGLRRLGAVIICKTTVPMSMMVGETASNIFGTTVCPYNTAYSAGGACGGEGALLACRGSALGIGTEIAGSCRIPSTFNALWSLKCSEERLPGGGLGTALKGLPIQAGSIGLMSHARSTLKYVFEAILASCPWKDDAKVVQIPWRQAEYDDIARRRSTGSISNGRLVFGMMLTDGFEDPSESIKHALRMTKRRLEDLGHEIVEWNPPPQNKATETLFKIFGSTAGHSIRATIDASGEPPIPQLKNWYQQDTSESISAADFWALCAERDEHRRQYFEYWEVVNNSTTSGRCVDGVILPVVHTTGVRQGELQYYGYSAIVNLLDAAAGTFPVHIPKRSSSHASTMEAARQEATGLESHEMPVGLQIMCKRHQEERVLALLETIDEAFKVQDL